MGEEQAPEGMTWSAECDEVFAAIAKAQATMSTLTASKTAEVRIKAEKGGGKYSYSYAGLPDTLEACLTAFNAQGCAIVQPVTSFNNGVEVRTIIAHSSGQWVKGPALFIGLKNNAGAQDIGSAITYARRYSLQGMVGLSPADDDGGKAQGSAPDRWEEPRRSERRTQRQAPQERTPTLREQVCRRVGMVAEELRLRLNEAWYECLAAAELPGDLGGDIGPESPDITDTQLVALLAATHKVLEAGTSDPKGAP